MKIKREINILLRQLANRRVLKQDRLYRILLNLIRITSDYGGKDGR